MLEVKRFQKDYSPESPKAVVEGLAQIQSLLPPEMTTFLGEFEDVASVVITDYQSPTFRLAGYDLFPEKYGRSDGLLVEITRRSGQQLFVMAQKVRTGPYEVGYAGESGLDLRPVIVCSFRVGDDQVEVMNPSFAIETYKGEIGHLDVFMPSLRQTLGYQVGSETFLDSV